MRSRNVAVTFVVIALALGACSSTVHDNAADAPTTPTTAAATAAAPDAPAPDCGDPVVSFAPTGARPAPNQMPAGTFMAQIQQRGYLIAAVSADTYLFGYRNPLDGQIEGFDIDVVHRIAQAIFGDPNKVQFKVVNYAGRIPALQSNQADIVADVMTMNCKRWAQIDFSSQYFESAQRVLVAANSRANSITDLFGQKVCVADGSTNLDKLKESFPQVVRVVEPDVSDCMVLFQQGAVAGVTGDDTVLAGFVAQDPYAKIIGAQLTHEPYGLGISKAHPEFVRFVNSVLDDVRSDGTWQQWYTKWKQPPPVPAPPPAKYGRTP